MDTDVERVLSYINREELGELATSLANIYSPPGQEKEVADFVEEWLQHEGFETKVISLTP